MLKYFFDAASTFLNLFQYICENSKVLCAISDATKKETILKQIRLYIVYTRTAVLFWLLLCIHFTSVTVENAILVQKLTTWRILFSVSYTVQSCKRGRRQKKKKTWDVESISVNIRTDTQISPSSKYNNQERQKYEKWDRHFKLPSDQVLVWTLSSIRL